MFFLDFNLTTKNKIEVQLAAQTTVVNALKNKIHDRQIIQTTKAFKFVYISGALISLLTLPVVLLTDRKIKNIVCSSF